MTPVEKGMTFSIFMSKSEAISLQYLFTSIKPLGPLAALALPAMEKAGAKFLARGLPVAVREEGQKTRTVVIEWPSIEAANAGYNGPDYQAALDALDGSASREFRYVEATY